MRQPAGIVDDAAVVGVVGEAWNGFRFAGDKIGRILTKLELKIKDISIWGEQDIWPPMVSEIAEKTH